MATQTASRPVPLRPVERDTLGKIFWGAVERFGAPDAMRYKAEGEWRTLSHHEVQEQVTHLAAALAASGIGAGDRVAILSENRPEWAITDYAVVGMGAVDVPVYATLPPNQIEYILQDSGARVVFVSTREQLAKVLEIRDALPDLQQVIAFDDPGAAPGVEHFRDVLESGRRAVASGAAGEVRERALAVQPDDVATLIYTSGTTGTPKGVMLTHWNLASNVAGSQQHGVSEMLHRGDVALSFLPLSHVFERMIDYLYWDLGVSIAYVESIDKVAENLAEVRPNVAVSVPRLFEKIYTRVTVATGIRKRLLLWAKDVGERSVDRRLAGGEPSGALAIQQRLADRLVFSKLRDRVGGKMRIFVSGGAPLSADVAKFFLAAGLPIYEGYGLTETSPVITANTPDRYRLGTVGTVIPGVEVRIEGNGEILTRGPNIMKGYWQNPEATAEEIDADGWFHTGDVGELDADGFLRITDRIKNLLVTAGGKNIAPQPIESRAAMSPYVAQVVMLGDRRAYPTLLVVPDWENLTPWAASQGIDTTDPEVLARDPRVHEFLEGETLGHLDDFARFERPKKIAVIPQEFTVDEGLLTPTMKVKRRAVQERYGEVIEEMYGEEEEAD